VDLVKEVATKWGATQKSMKGLTSGEERSLTVAALIGVVLHR
jgi:hypothetical protein